MFIHYINKNQFCSETDFFKSYAELFIILKNFFNKNYGRQKDFD